MIRTVCSPISRLVLLFYKIASKLFPIYFQDIYLSKVITRIQCTGKFLGKNSVQWFLYIESHHCQSCLLLLTMRILQQQSVFVQKISKIPFLSSSSQSSRYVFSNIFIIYLSEISAMFLSGELKKLREMDQLGAAIISVAWRSRMNRRDGWAQPEYEISGQHFWSCWLCSKVTFIILTQTLCI